MSQEIRDAHEVFQAAVSGLATANAEYATAADAYLEKKAALVAAIDTVDAADNALEALTAAYEPPAHPNPQ